MNDEDLDIYNLSKIKCEPDDEELDVEFPDYDAGIRRVTLKEETLESQHYSNVKTMIHTMVIFNNYRNRNELSVESCAILVCHNGGSSHVFQQTNLPWFDPTDYTDEEIKERISKLLIFS